MPPGASTPSLTEQRRWALVCLQGLLGPGGRKSVEPMAARGARRCSAASPLHLHLALAAWAARGGVGAGRRSFDEFMRLFRTTPGRVFLSWSAQNVDRTVTLYRAAKRSGRTLMIDLYTFEGMEALSGHGRLPHPGLSNLKVVITTGFPSLLRKQGRGEFVDRMAKVGIGARDPAREPGRWVSMIRPSLVNDLSTKGVVPNPDDACSWSLWQGYLAGEDGQALASWFDGCGARAHHLHTSGHAPPQDLRAFAQATGAATLVPVPGLASDTEQAGFPNLRRLADGEVLRLDERAAA